MIHTARLILRRARPDDLADVHSMLSDPRAMRYWSRPEHDSIDESRDWLDRMIAAPDADDYLIEREGRVIGKAGMWRRPEVGFLLHPDHQGAGLASEAMTAVITHLFDRHDMPELVAEADPRNTPSLRLLARLGFTETGRAERTMKWREEWCDSVYLALPRAAWPLA
ncbi:GNAT family N-acetyltransferase [Paragemmobacter straminiformis]|uniref:GNAT family N-acetyltransferase n=1 Tax=Paragemmobacter straminiformis TaxID=2045119 RepID=A0A842I7A4_9RHOB|nr:GNAT family N-acetyltransferase [Gemmobacter straminiformis]MBC2835506.1 GNAT family N-acetyltransferase [Gemmobacter straminiformis]